LITPRPRPGGDLFVAAAVASQGRGAAAELRCRRDVARSAAGRAIAEWVFWTPAALLFRPGVVWEPVASGTPMVRPNLTVGISPARAASYV